MRTLLLSLLLLSLLPLLLLSGCSVSQNTGSATAVVVNLAQYAPEARAAGTVAAAAWSATNPNADAKSAVADVVTLLRGTLGDYQAGGFTSSLPTIQAVIASKYASKPAVVAVANQFAGLALEGLDALFAAHPSWQTQGAGAAGLVTEFLDGAGAGLQTSAK
jgi:hypothetical protein